MTENGGSTSSSNLGAIGGRLVTVGVIAAMVLGAVWFLNAFGGGDVATGVVVGFFVAALVAVVGWALRAKS